MRQKIAMTSTSIDFDKIQKLSDDPFYFVKNCVFTRDEVDLKAPIKLSPSDLNYVRLFCETFVTKRRIVVPKSRRMWVTWLCLSLFLWDTMFNRIRANFIQSKKEDDANNLIDRIEFILENIPEEFFPKKIRPPYKRTYCHLEFPTIGSYLKAVPQGADQLRQYTASGVLMDEFAFWDQGEETFAATAPTTQGGGRIVIVSTPPDDSSPDGSFFERLVFDRLA